MLKEKIVDSETGEETWRDYTPAQIAEVERNEEETIKEAAKLNQAAAAKAALLKKLGITEDEAKLLLS